MLNVECMQVADSEQSSPTSFGPPTNGALIRPGSAPMSIAHAQGSVGRTTGASTIIFPATAAIAAALPRADTNFRRASRKPSTLFSSSPSASSASSCTWLSWTPRAGASISVSRTTAATAASHPLADTKFRRATRKASTHLSCTPSASSASPASPASSASSAHAAHASPASPASSAHTANAGSSVRRRRRIHLHRGGDLLLDGHVAHRNRRRGAGLHALLVGLSRANRPVVGSRHRFWLWTTRQHHRGIQFRWIRSSQRDVT